MLAVHDRAATREHPHCVLDEGLVHRAAGAAFMGEPAAVWRRFLPRDRLVVVLDVSTEAALARIREKPAHVSARNQRLRAVDVSSDSWSNAVAAYEAVLAETPSQIFRVRAEHAPHDVAAEVLSVITRQLPN